LSFFAINTRGIVIDGTNVTTLRFVPLATKVKA
jgi:hypothetical protein